MTNAFTSVEDALKALKAGQMIILTDDESRENEGDLVIAAEHVTAESINFMARFGRGLICLPMARQFIDKLGLPMMSSLNRSPYGTAFTVSIEAASGVATGISAADRAHTIQVAIDDSTTPQDIISPGHIFPLSARPNGVLERNGQTEGSVDLMQLAGLKPAAVICEIMNDDGTMSRQKDLVQFAKTHDLKMLSVQDVMDYRIRAESLVQKLAQSTIPLKHYGEFQMTVYKNEIDHAEHFTLIKPPIDPSSVSLVRVHSECITGDLFGSKKCDCGAQLDLSLERIAKEGGILIYLRQEGRGIGLPNKIKAYALQETGLDTVEANEHLGLPVDGRSYAPAYQILKHLGLNKIQLMTNNPKKIEALEYYGITVKQRIPVHTSPTNENKHYLLTKRNKFGHDIDGQIDHDTDHRDHKHD